MVKLKPLNSMHAGNSYPLDLTIIRLARFKLADGDILFLQIMGIGIQQLSRSGDNADVA